VQWRYVLDRNSGASFAEIDAFLRGPDLAPIESQLAALVASLRYDPPASSGPSGSPAGAAQASASLAPMDIRFAGSIGCASFPYGCTATLSVVEPSAVLSDAWRPPSSDPWWAPDWTAGTEAHHFAPTPVGLVPGLSPGQHQLVVSLLGSSDVPSYNPDGSRAFDLVGRCSATVDVPATATSVSVVVTFVPNGANFQTACSLQTTSG